MKISIRIFKIKIRCQIGVNLFHFKTVILRAGMWLRYGFLDEPAGALFSPLC